MKFLTAATLLVVLVVLAAFVSGSTPLPKDYSSETSWSTEIKGKRKWHLFVPEAEVVNIDKRVVGGAPAEEGQFPYSVSLHNAETLALYTPLMYGKGLTKSHFCNAVLISRSWISTGGHCALGLVEKITAKDLAYVSRSIVANFGDINMADTTWANRNSEYLCKREVHENFDLATIQNDIGLFKTCQPITFTLTISPAFLPKFRVNLDYKTVILCGNGVTVENGTAISPILLTAAMPVVPNAECQKSYDNNITEAVLCAGYMDKGGIDACDGDSGAPLTFITPSGQKAVVGVVSFGYFCARPEYPSVYTRIDYYLDWIILKVDEVLQLLDISAA